MKGLYRKGVHKKTAAKKFRHHVKRTKVANLKAIPMRGGFRL